LSSFTSPASLDELRTYLDELSAAFMKEEYLALAGLKTPDFDGIFRRYGGTYTDEEIAGLAQRMLAEDNPTVRGQLRLLLDNLWMARSVRAIAPAYQKIVHWCATRTIDVGGGRAMDFNQASSLITNTSDACERHRIDDARAAAVATELVPLLIDQFEAQKADARSLGVGPFICVWEQLKALRLPELIADANQFLADTSDLWSKASREVLATHGVTGRELTRADALAIFRFPAYDALFPAARREQVVLSFIRSLGLDPLADGRIRIDCESRPGKYPRAFCAPVRVPGEVYLVTSPGFGGPQEWSILLHEIGHALHYANTDPSLPLENRRLGDMAVTEAYAMLFANLLLNPTWLERHAGIADRAVEFARAQNVHELYQLRRYCARLTYEKELYDEAADYERLPARYAELLTEATGFRHRPEDAFLDVDASFYTTNYIRARMLRPILRAALEEQFGVPWWADPGAGRWLVDVLFSHGNRWSADELAQRLSGRPLAFRALREAIETALQ
jgi:hypothetical protein